MANHYHKYLNYKGEFNLWQMMKIIQLVNYVEDMV